MYNRGGKVWVGKNAGLVFLEEDWKLDRLPEDLVEEAGLLGAEFELLSIKERAELAGYFMGDELVEFICKPPLINGESLHSDIYLAWEENGWLSSMENSSEWKLKKTEEGFYSLAFPIDKLMPLKEFPFKYRTESGVWFDPPDFLPSQVESLPGSSNYLFNPSRTGRDILRFDIVKGQHDMTVEKWLKYRPDNLGYSLSGTESCFRVFAPRAHRVKLNIHTKGVEQQEIINDFEMKSLPDGTWEFREEKDFENAYYSFDVFHFSHPNNQDTYSKRILDPYAEACLGRNGPGLIPREERIEPNKGKNFQTPKMCDLVIAEAHIRDLLQNAPINLSEEQRTGFSGLAKWMKSEDCYLRKLGINAVELQPIHQFDSRNKEEYHWGYMPVNFFSPASDYSTSARLAQEECKQLIDSFHGAGIAVILDVVYNHFGIPNHLLNIDREIYLQTDELGKLTNHSGCGNDLNCDGEPVKKMIIDSLKHWVLKYHVDGFRFDLAELLGIELLKEIEGELKKLNPNIILIAEPWSFRGRLPEKMNQSGYALWSDRCRESLLGFVSGKVEKEEIVKLMMGKLDVENCFPWQSVHYVESHDDYTFIDRICSDCENGGLNPDANAMKKATLAMVILLLSPGIPMLSAGQDFLRSKKGIRNTYQNGNVNALDYRRLEKYKSIHNEIRKIITFRRSQSGRFTRPETFKKIEYTSNLLEGRNILSLSAQHQEQGEEFLFVCNSSNENARIQIPEFWLNGKIILPEPAGLSYELKLAAWGYALMRKEVI